MATPRGTTGAVGADLTAPSRARVHDLFLGGKDNFAVDREVADGILAAAPQAARVMRRQRAWQQRALRWVVVEAGLDQVVDLGCGLPARVNTHDVVAAAGRGATVVYVDNDPSVSAYGQALLADGDRTFFADADLTRVGELCRHPQLAHVEWDRPVVLMHCFTLHHLDDETAAGTMAAYRNLLAPGSYVLLSHTQTPEPDAPPELTGAYERYRTAFPTFRPRTREQILGLAAGFDLVEPGLVPVDDWWPEGPGDRRVSAAAAWFVGLVARKPG